MNTENFEEEIDILNLTKHILSKWKILLVAGLCFAALGFGYKYYKTEFSKVPLAEVDELFEIERVNANGEKEKVKVSYNLYVEDYYAKLAQYNSALQAQKDHKRALETDLEKIEDQISNDELYYRESILHNMDPANFSKVSKTILIYNKELDHAGNGMQASSDEASASKDVSANQKVNTPASSKSTSNEAVQNINVETSTDSIYVNYLSSYMQSSNLSDKVRVLLNKKKEKFDSYIRELYGFTVNGNSINFYAQSDSEQLSKSILSLIENELKVKLSEILTPDMSYRLVDADIYNGFSNWIYNKKIDDKNNLITLKNQIDEKMRQLTSNVTPIKPEVLIKNPKGPVSIEKYKLKKYIIFTLAGFVFGVFALSGLYILLYLVPGRIRDKSLFANSFGIRTLAAFSSDNDEFAKKILSEQLDVHANGMKKIAMVSSLDNEKIAESVATLVNLLQTKSISSVVVNQNQVLDIANSDAVIFLEKIDVSKTSKVIEELDVVQDLKKDILGFVYF